MPRIATRHAHKLAYRRRFSLGVRMLGCLVMLAGVLVLIAAGAEAAKGSLSRSVQQTTCLGAVLSVCGAVLVWGERGKLLDRESRTLKSWWGIGFPWLRSFHDLRTYQAIGIQPFLDHTVTRWRVALFSELGERIDLFELTNEEAAQLAARQVAMFLSLAVAPLPPVAAEAGTTLPATDVPQPAASLGSEGEATWRHRERFALPVRALGIVVIALGMMVMAGLLASDERGRWPSGLAVMGPLWIFGFWLIIGGRIVEVSPEANAVTVWRLWPLPPAIYELSVFYAVMVAPSSPESVDEEAASYLIGLIGADRLRLEIIRALPRDDARAMASQLAATAKLPVIDESQTTAAPPAASV